ncbi:hypothetical protein [Compostibacter hankyongensis]
MKYFFRGKMLLLICGLAGVLSAGCQKDYYADGGLADPHYAGSIYDYLANDPYYFDTITYIIDRAGMKTVLQEDTVTFFSPTDDAIKGAMDDLNSYRYTNLEDSVHLEDISPEVWRYFLSMYILEGKFTANKFPRVDPNNIFSYPGINYVMYDGYVLNIGLIYQDYGGAEAVGARILNLTDITYNPSDFRKDPKVQIATSDIQPLNGVLHVLKNSHVFGFRQGEFKRIAEQYLLLGDPSKSPASAYRKNKNIFR